MWREDFSDADGKVKRRQRNVKLDTVADLPTRTTAREALTRRIGALPKPEVEMTLSDLFAKWKKVAGASLRKTTYDHHVNALTAHVVPAFGDREITCIERYELASFFSTQAAKYAEAQFAVCESLSGSCYRT